MQTEVLTPFALDLDISTWMLGLVAVFVLLGVWSSLGRMRAGGSMRLTARNLFLTVRSGDGYQVHIVTLATRQLTFVSPRYVGKGEKVRLEVQTLPGFPEDGAPLETEVTQARPMSSDAQTFLITAKILSGSAHSQPQLKRFLEQLTRPGRLSHA